MYHSTEDIGRAYRLHLDGTKLYLVDFEGIIHVFEIQVTQSSNHSSTPGFTIIGIFSSTSLVVSLTREK